MTRSGSLSLRQRPRVRFGDKHPKRKHFEEEGVMTTAATRRNPYRADHVGSLLRPMELIQARKVHQEGRITLEELRKLEDRSILQALDMEKQSGISVFSDGELRRSSWSEAWGRVLEPFTIPDPDGATAGGPRPAGSPPPPPN